MSKKACIPFPYRFLLHPGLYLKLRIAKQPRARRGLWFDLSFILRLPLVSKLLHILCYASVGKLELRLLQISEPLRWLRGCKEIQKFLWQPSPVAGNSLLQPPLSLELGLHSRIPVLNMLCSCECLYMECESGLDNMPGWSGVLGIITKKGVFSQKDFFRVARLLPIRWLRCNAYSCTGRLWTSGALGDGLIAGHDLWLRNVSIKHATCGHNSHARHPGRLRSRSQNQRVWIILSLPLTRT